MPKPTNASSRLSGDQNASSFIVLQGYLVRLGKQSMINSPRAGIYPVTWKDNRLPEKAKLGSYVTIVGKLVTLDLGRAFIVIQARQLRPKSLRKIKKEIHSHLIVSKENG